MNDAPTPPGWVKRKRRRQRLLSPNNFRVQRLFANSIVVEWDPPTIPVEEYKINCYSTSEHTTVTIIDGDTTDCNIPGLSGGVDYTVEIYGIDRVGMKSNIRTTTGKTLVLVVGGRPRR